MVDRPILFSPAMIRALLAGTKTQTRRVIKPRHNPNRPSLFDGTWSDNYVLDPGNQKWRDDAYPWRDGDRLWVREAWRSAAAYDDLAPSAMGGEEPIQYQADGAHQTWGYPAIAKIGRLRSSMFMPRWASRLTLVVTGVKVERLQDISETDAIAEGIGRTVIGDGYRDRFTVRPATWAQVTGHEVSAWEDPREAYAALWCQINGPGAWGANPWVVALTFTVHRQNIDALKEAA
ncbi:hypothetical protein AB4037_23040 [Labrys sp. KB_33_2]|uniref:hypothetical protein n=1 Tax=Labrys sp. KB_33_2 TaxID=3237479 RepID=UPI003F915417